MYIKKVQCIRKHLKANADIYHQFFLNISSNPPLSEVEFKKEFLRNISALCDCEVSMIYKIARDLVDNKDLLYYLPDKWSELCTSDLNESLLYKERQISKVIFYKDRAVSDLDFKYFMYGVLNDKGFKNTTELFKKFTLEANVYPPLIRKTFIRYLEKFIIEETNSPEVGKYRIIKSKELKRGYYTAYKSKNK